MTRKKRLPSNSVSRAYRTVRWATGADPFWLLDFEDGRARFLSALKHPREVWLRRIYQDRLRQELVTRRASMTSRGLHPDLVDDEDYAKWAIEAQQGGYPNFRPGEVA